jgi:hypothetical protein
MKIHYLLALVGLAISFALPTFAQEKDTVDPQTRQQLEAIIEKYEEAFNKHDAAAVAAFYTEDAALDSPLGVFSGRLGVEKYYLEVFQQFNPGQAPGDESYPDPILAGRFELAGQPLSVTVAAADEAQTAGAADGGGEKAAGNEVYGRQQYGVPDTEPVGPLCVSVISDFLLFDGPRSIR